MLDDEPRTPEDEAASEELYKIIGDPPTTERIEKALRDGDLISDEELVRRLDLVRKNKAK